MKIDISKIKDVEGSHKQTIMHTGFVSTVTLLGHVCTARFIQGMSSAEGVAKKEVEHWIKILTEADEVYNGNSEIGALEGSYVLYKPQSLVAMTNMRQTRANKALEELGFEPSRPVLNMKYGRGSELITWTYALHGFLEDEEGE